jgi:hypothetical protein
MRQTPSKPVHSRHVSHGGTLVRLKHTPQTLQTIDIHEVCHALNPLCSSLY